MKEKIILFSNRIKNYIKPAFILSGLLLLGISSIIRANFKYIDDYGRVLQGYKGWDDFSRYFSFGISAFIHADNYLTDISPLPQVMACVLLGIAGIIVIDSLKNNSDEKISLWQMIAVIPLGLSPYFLECMSYKYDSVYMALSVFAALLPMAFAETGLIAFSIASFCGTLLMLTTYQASSGILPMIVVLWTAKKLNEGSKISEVFKKTGVAAGGYVLAMLIDKLFIIREVDEYVTSTVAPITEIVTQFVNYYKQVISDFKTWWLIIIAIIIILYAVMYVKESKINRAKSAGIAVLSVALCILLAFGTYPMLKRASYYPRAMYGFGVLIALFSVAAVSYNKAYVARIFTLALSWTFLVFSFSYGNALYEQGKYTDIRVEAVVNDIIELEMMNTGETVNVQLVGGIGKSPVIRNIPQGNYEILDRLVPETFAEGWKWSEFYFYNYFDLNMNKATGLTELDLPVIKETPYYIIKGEDNNLVIELKGK